MGLKTNIENALRQYPSLGRLSSKRAVEADGASIRPSDAALEALERALEEAHQSRHGDIGDYFELAPWDGASFAKVFAVCQRLGLDDTQLFGFGSTADNSTAVGGIDRERVVLLDVCSTATLADEIKAALPRRCAGIVALGGGGSATQAALYWLEEMLLDAAILLFEAWDEHEDDDPAGQRFALAAFMQRWPRWRVEEMWPFDRCGSALRLHLKRPGD